MITERLFTFKKGQIKIEQPEEKFFNKNFSFNSNTLFAVGNTVKSTPINWIQLATSQHCGGDLKNLRHFDFQPLLWLIDWFTLQTDEQTRMDVLYSKQMILAELGRCLVIVLRQPRTPRINRDEHVLHLVKSADTLRNN